MAMAPRSDDDLAALRGTDAEVLFRPGALAASGAFADLEEVEDSEPVSVACSEAFPRRPRRVRSSVRAAAGGAAMSAGLVREERVLRFAIPPRIRTQREATLDRFREAGRFVAGSPDRPATRNHRSSVAATDHA